MSTTKKRRAKVEIPRELYEPFREPLKWPQDGIMPWRNGKPVPRTQKNESMYELYEGFTKLDLIAKHYGFEGLGGGNTLVVLLKLARDIFPGFRFEGRGGNTQGGVTKANDLLLVGMIEKQLEEQLKDGAEKNISAACKKITADGPFKGKDPEKLRQRYHNVLSTLPELIRDMLTNPALNTPAAKDMRMALHLIAPDSTEAPA